LRIDKIWQSSAIGVNKPETAPVGRRFEDFASVRRVRFEAIEEMLGVEEHAPSLRLHPGNRLFDHAKVSSSETWRAFST
jgi:hypothetical protein